MELTICHRCQPSRNRAVNPACWLISRIPAFLRERPAFLAFIIIHHWAVVVSRGWAKASACRLQITLSCAFLCHIVSLQYLSRSSLHRLAGLPCRIFLSYGLQVVTREVHRSSLRHLICPAQDHFIFLTVLIISMTFVLSLTQMLVFLSVYVMLSILLSILVCAAASLFCACLVSVQGWYS